MAQLVAHSLWERGVVSSSLAAPTSLRLSGASARQTTPGAPVLRSINYGYRLKRRQYNFKGVVMICNKFFSYLYFF